MLPNTLRSHIEENIPQKIQRSVNLSGGSINEAVKLLLDDGTEIFLKWNSGKYQEMFEVEQKGLETLRNADCGFLIPNIFASGTTPDNQYTWLLLEYVDQGRSDGPFFDYFGARLAQLHSNTAGEYGLAYDNFIGRLPQKNSKIANWNEFFVTNRLEPQLSQAINSGLLDYQVGENFERLFSRLDDLIPNSPPSLLHGDLWSGNFLAAKNGDPVLIDPAVYYGHREIELAFTKLFGGFSSNFYKSYNEQWPLEPGFEDRVAIFNLYPLLVHVNLFGRAYTSQVISIINNF